MKIQVKFLRAIGSEFIGRKIKPIFIILGIVLLIFLIGILWLTTVSSWWWLAAVPTIIFSTVVLIIFIVITMIINKLRPNLTPSQAQDVESFVSKLERVAENIQTPMFFIVLRVGRDIISPRKNSFTQSVIEDSTTLHKDFLELKRSFER